MISFDKQMDIKNNNAFYWLSSNKQLLHIYIEDRTTPCIYNYTIVYGLLNTAKKDDGRNLGN